MDEMGQTNNELTVHLIETYSMLQRIKADEKGENPTLDYELKKVEVQLHSVGVNTDNLIFAK